MRQELGGGDVLMVFKWISSRQVPLSNRSIYVSVWQILIGALISRHTIAMDHPEGDYHLQKRTETLHQHTQHNIYSVFDQLAFQQTLLATFKCSYP
jgi:hypothetical protein